MLKLSTKTRYGLRAMIDLAQHSNGEPVFLSAIARRQGISRNYLDALFASLRQAGMVRSVRGATGGYFLAAPPEETKVLDIVRALEGSPVIVDCLEKEGSCARSGSCSARPLWKRLRATIEGVLSETTLGQLAGPARGDGKGACDA